MNVIDSALSKKYNGDRNNVRQENPLVLASVGDAVYSLKMRAYLAATHSFSAHSLHTNASRLVCARAQREAFSYIEGVLYEDEAYIAKRGRNSHPGTIPKNADVLDYRIATALEAVFGYLYLLGEFERIDELLNIILEKKNGL